MLQEIKVNRDRYYKVGYYPELKHYILAKTITWIAWYERYYSISDGTLFFIKIKGLGAEEHTLPQAVSASGSRYTDFLNFECLVKDDEMQVLELDSDGNWKPIFSGRERK